ncbi:PepSY domain-containing protein [Pedobacter rhizosphaerae]|uniref:NADPH--hemoprotein reductase n=1 Tax=Pedobacter rhizosphaerae TaxID=390241 RepID=A0A1H9QY37_9SPHI|nr:PepSY domain-containing protein [Pedobacter rhizosphaerae]SER65382.1 sulfite reductase (NADPH) flavoprotein alpha-component [Pedobacter rhizosphaerae]
MIKSIWRYSHLTLAVSSFLFLLLAAVTGIILSAEPISQKNKSYGQGNLDEITVAQLIPTLQAKYDEVTSISVSHKRFVEIQAIDTAGGDVKAYISPETGKVLGQIEQKNEFFQWVTTLHRSLFLHSAGRIVIGLTAFLLILIAISGILLTIQRQRGLRRLFAKIHKDDFSQYYHVVLGRILLIPILIIAISGTYLSLNTLGVLKTAKKGVEVNIDEIKSGPQKKIKDFEVFQQISLSDVEKIEFPFSTDIEDYYILTLKDREIAVNQVTGVLLAESKYPFALLATNLSLDLHTGRANLIWALVLAISCIGILFFIYSGFAITLKRLSKRTRNKFSAAESQFIILVGSENGSSYGYASHVHQLLIKAGKKSYITTLNQYTVYPNASQLIIFTSTYGLGDPPANAGKFLQLVLEKPQLQPVQYSVLGFGSKAYADFCKFAFDVHNELGRQNWSTPLIDIHTVNDKSLQEISLWAEAWSQQSGIELPGFPKQKRLKTKSLQQFVVRSNTAIGTETATFQINLDAKRKLKVKSGDLLAIYPANDHRERLYSIGVVAGAIQLSVRLHPDGLGSGYLHKLKAKEDLKAKIIRNPHFYFPKQASKVIMISNGTGIAPFLGMIDENEKQVPCYLFSGFRASASFEPFKSFLAAKIEDQKLTRQHIAFSREGEKQYVSDLIKLEADWIAESLKNAAVLMLCGSLAMQKDILAILETICQEKTGQSISFYQSRNQVLTDCY